MMAIRPRSIVIDERITVDPALVDLAREALLTIPQSMTYDVAASDEAIVISRLAKGGVLLRIMSRERAKELSAVWPNLNLSAPPATPPERPRASCFWAVITDGARAEQLVNWIEPLSAGSA